jgi:hypothetical protein
MSKQLEFAFILDPNTNMDDVLIETGAECTTMWPAMDRLSITLLSSSDGALSTESSIGSYVTRGVLYGESVVTLTSSAVSTNAESKHIPPTLWQSNSFFILLY